MRPFLILLLLAGLIAALPIEAEEPPWEEVVFREEPASRLVSGVFYRDRIYSGTHNPASVYSFSPSPLGAEVHRVFLPDPKQPGEAVIHLIEFQRALYGIVEKTPGELRQWNPESRAWEISFTAPRDGLFFGELFQGRFYLTGGATKGLTVYRSGDGRKFEEQARLPDWVWLPVVFQEQLFLLGHAGSAYHPGEAAAYAGREDQTFGPVPALSGGPEYQTALVWKNRLFLGTGGWTTDRKAGNLARVYRYDGVVRTEVLRDIRMNGITSFAACGRHLYALADSGWESPVGGSALYRTIDGDCWELAGTFPYPEMRKIIVVNDKALVLVGGKNREYGVVLSNESLCRGEEERGGLLLPNKNQSGAANRNQ